MKKLTVLFFIICSQQLNAQIGGFGIYKFMNIPSTSRTAALGGNSIMIKDDDVGLAIQNPALLNKQMSTCFSASYINYIKDISVGSFIGAFTVDSVANFSAGLHYINYGTFERTDIYGNKLGTFTAAEYNIFLQASREWKNYSYGITTKFLYSQLESYKSYGVAMDIGGTYYDPKKNFTVSVVIKNMGNQIKTYSQFHEPLPFEIQYGMSYKPKHAPLRFSLGLHDLQKYDLTYINTNKTPQKDLQTGLDIVETIPFSEKIARHITAGAEVLLTPGFQLQFGYNHKLRKEMTLPDNRGLVGFSGGIRIKVYKFFISYGVASFHAAGLSNTISLSSNIGAFFDGKVVEKVVQ
ncbi:MAG: type IX secretion system protein PorQ [Bacteroidetes bacterium]|nr:type IX secretion system protein PorQ [Bacteroidota bacterium]